MSKIYHCAFAPLVNAQVPSDDMLDCGSFRVRSVRNKALRDILDLMHEHSPDKRDTFFDDLEEADEAAFVVKDIQINEDDTDYDPDSDIISVKYTPKPYDVFCKERICFNLTCKQSVFTPVVLCADDFPTVRSLAWFWNTEVGRREWQISSHEGQELRKSMVESIKKLMIRQSGEFIDERKWLTRALSKYESGNWFKRKSNDRLLDYFSALEALYTDDSTEGTSLKLPIRVAMVLSDGDEEYGEVQDRIKKLYDARSSNSHGSQTKDLRKDDLAELREYVRRGILMAFELSKQAKGPGDWQRICKRLLKPRDPELRQDLKNIRGGLGAIW